MCVKFMEISWKSGFTLIELLVVIAVLGVLAGGTVVAINPLAKINAAKMGQRRDIRSQTQ